jgi:hypothetical protein
MRCFLRLPGYPLPYLPPALPKTGLPPARLAPTRRSLAQRRAAH